MKRSTLINKEERELKQWASHRFCKDSFKKGEVGAFFKLNANVSQFVRAVGCIVYHAGNAPAV